MVEQEIKDEEKVSEECYCTKKIKVLVKEIKQLKLELDNQRKELLKLNKVIKSK
jgi:hypothetical protein